MKRLTKIFSVVMAVLMIFLLTACNNNENSSSANGEIVMQLGDITLTESEYMYIASYVKEQVVYEHQSLLYQYTGQVYDEADILAMPVDEDTTVAEYIKDYSIELCQKMLIMEKLAADAGLEITNQEDIDAINDYISDVEYAYGGADLFEVALARLGFSRSGIERFQSFSIIFELMYDYRYGDNGIAKISSESVYNYFTENYLHYDGALYSYTNLDDDSDITFEFSDDEVRDYFFDNFVKVRHVLYLTQNVSDDKKAELKQKADDALVAIESGEKTLDDYKSETDDSGYEYTFTYGEMVEPFETAAFEMSVGEVRVVESEYGYHIVEKLELTETDFAGTADDDGEVTGGMKEDVISAMSKNQINKEAMETLEKLSNGEIETYPDDNTDIPYYKKMTSQFINKTGSGNSFITSVLESESKDEYFVYEIKSDGTYIMRNLSFTSEDITADIYSAIEEDLAVESFSDYMETFFDSVTTNNEVLEKFDILTIPSLEDEFYVS